ncbi:hypothetical protein LUZ60_001546 [Juncus effusus]|nr:hypothetical protein LUZ60_001546 [Juncus effusus]
MEVAIFSFKSIIVALVCLIVIQTFLSFINKNKSKKLPPSPLALPLIGHLYLLKKPLHQTLSRVAQKYGPAIFLHFGSRPVLVISSYSLSEQCFTTHDMAFSNRVHLPSGKHIMFDYNHIAAANYGPHLRNVRQVVTMELLSAQWLHATLDVRAGEVRDLAHCLFQSWNTASARLMRSNYFEKVDLKTKLFELSLNVMMTMIAGKRFYGDNVDDLDEAKRFRKALEEFYALIGPSNLENFLPVLRLLGVTGTAKKLKHLAELNEEMSQKLIDEHRRGGEKKKNTMIAKLLELQKENPQKYDDKIIQIIAISLLQAVTDTTSSSVEWAMALLLNNPDVLKKATNEIDEHVRNERLIQESDMVNLPYLHSILQEVLPSVPVGGGGGGGASHDPRITRKSKPERFEGEIKAKWMIPFGMGRRRCLGEGLALRELGLILGTLIQCLDWERVGDELVDMTEGSALTLSKADPLEALYRPGPVMMKILSSF